MHPQGLRQKKVARLLEKMLNEHFRANASEYAGALVTVTQIWVAQDLRMARVYLSIFSPQTEKIALLKTIVEQSRALRGQVGKQLGKQLQHIPELFFKLDESLDEMAKIDALLAQ